MKNLLVIVVVMATLGSPDLFARRKYAPVPDKVLKAKTVYLDDQSGYPGVTDKAYRELTKWGRFKVVSTRTEADLILLLSAREYTGGYIYDHFEWPGQPNGRRRHLWPGIDHRNSAHGDLWLSDAH